MCSIFGVLSRADLTLNQQEKQANTMEFLIEGSSARGRDGVGIASHPAMQLGFAKAVFTGDEFIANNMKGFATSYLAYQRGTFSFVGNFRAEPTTEYVSFKTPDDQQPYILNGWAIAHNGTIANDKEIRTNEYPTRIDSAAIVEVLEPLRPNCAADAFITFNRAVRQLQGSYAILAVNEAQDNHILAACNYRPIWYATDDTGMYFGSTRECFPEHMVAAMLPPYTLASFFYDELNDVFEVHTESLYGNKGSRALVICSGGLDSVTAAAWALEQGYSVELAHFVYGCRAENHEVEAVHAVAEYYDVPLHIIPMGIYDKKDSPLLQDKCDIAGGEAGAEFAHEWVPARNLVMLSIATAFAEAKGFDYIMLGNNLEEAGAYPDNEPEFISRFNDLLPFAVGANKRVEVLQPLGNLMKHEIVKLGYELNAPLHKTWSCYKHGAEHCGQCGPCFMRKTAFEINGLDEVIPYATDEA